MLLTERNKKSFIRSFFPLHGSRMPRSTGAMNQSRALESLLQPGYCPQTHNSSSGNAQALSKMASAPGEKQKSKSGAIWGEQSLFLSQSKNDLRLGCFP